MCVGALDVRQHGDGGQSDQIPEQVVGARGRTIKPKNCGCPARRHLRPMLRRRLCQHRGRRLLQEPRRSGAGVPGLG